MLSDLKSLDVASRRSFLEYAAQSMLGVTIVPGLMNLRGAMTFAAVSFRSTNSPAK